MIGTSPFAVAAKNTAELMANTAKEIRAGWSPEERRRRSERADERTRRLYRLLFATTYRASDLTALGATTAEDMQRLVG
jgi:hypothetical protein